MSRIAKPIPSGALSAFIPTASAGADPVAGDPPADTPSPALSLPPVTIARASRAWDDTPMQTKTGLLVALACVGGAGLSIIDARLGLRGWLLWLGIPALIGSLVLLSWYWVHQPLESLAMACDRIGPTRSPGALDELPTQRQDEVGQMARAIKQLAIGYIRNTCDAKQLRRTMDQRVTQATRQATRQFQLMAMRDPLTQLGNRRFLDETLDGLVRSILAANSTLGCVAIDCDHFKAVNDKLGHDRGDRILTYLASVIQAIVRQEDYAIRLGGDEFLILMPGCTRERLTQVAQQLRSLFKQNLSTVLPEPIPADLSIGLSLMPDFEMLTGMQLLKAADKNLYAAKKAGRARFCGP